MAICATETLKTEIAEGARSRAPTLEFEIDDPRLAKVIAELERRGTPGVRVVVRPWTEATVEDGLPVEFRVFRGPSGTAVTNYHARRPLPDICRVTAERARSLTKRLERAVAVVAFSADFPPDPVR